MTTVEDALGGYLETRDALSGLRGGLKRLDREIYGSDGAGEIDESFVLFEPDTGSAVVVGIETILFGLERYADRQVKFYETRIDLRTVLDTWGSSIEDALRATSSTERIAKIAELLPGLGTTFRRANIDTLMEEAADTAREFKREIARIDTAYTESLDTWKTVRDAAEGAGITVGAVATVLTVMGYVRNGLDTGDWSPRLFAQSAGAANVEAGDPRLVNAMTAWSDRFSATAAPVTDGYVAFDEALSAVEARMADAGERLAVFEASIAEAEALIDQLKALPGKLAPFTDVLGAVAKPFDSIFDFLENPPKVFGVPVFPAISRESIDKIVDFLSGISDFLLGFLDPILDPLLGPVQDAVDRVLGKLVPIRDFVDPMDALDDLMAELRDAANVFDGVFDPLLATISDLGSLPGFVEEIERPDAGETRATYFGGDRRDVVVGRTAEPGAGMGIAGAVIWANGGNDKLTGTGLEDMLAAGDGNDRAHGLAGDDVIFGHGGDDRLFGDDGADLMTGNGGADRMFGGAGNDDMAGNGDDDLLVGGAGDDNMTAGAGDDSVKGGAGQDRLGGGGGNDQLRGGADDDLLVGGAGDDAMQGQGGSDRLVGGSGDDRLSGGRWDDTLIGGDGRDVLMGDEGDDRLFGGRGDDRLEGGAGSDVLVGGPGADVFVFDIGHGDLDIIRDWEAGVDRIDLGSGRFDDLVITQRNGHSFVETDTGDVLKLAGFTGPLTEADFIA